MLFKTASPDFKTNPGLIRPYNNIDKFVPYLVAPNTANELVLLRNHDPVRKYNQTTLYQIDELESDFIKNHEFHSPRLTYLNDTAYYSISFFNKKPITRGNKEIVAEGTIYINTNDSGIKKLSYKAFARDDFGSKKIFDLNLEYKLQEDKYYLNYLSFNNLFMTSNFSIADAHFHSNTIDMIFNQAYDTTGLDQEDFRVFWMERELEVRDMQMYPDSNMVRLKVDGTGEIYTEYPWLKEDSIDQYQNIAIDQDAFIFKNLGFEIANMNDLNGNPLEAPGYKEYYQYRELFVKESSTENTLIVNNLIDKQKPVFETQIFGEMLADFSWMNTPLITESFDSRLDSLENQVHRTGVENLLNRNEKIVNELVYMHTDREVYAPADTLWFKAYIRDMAKLDTSSLSQTLFVKIVNESGGSIDKARFLIENSNAQGQFILDHKLNEGVYYISAYTSWMQNFDVDQVQLKKILIRKERRPELQMELVLDRSVYFAGDTIKAVVHCFDEQNRDVDNVKYLYSVEAGKKNKLAGGRARTSGEIQDTLLLFVPEQLPENPDFSILGTHKGQALDTLYRLPVIRDIHINFFPEGGKRINSLSSNMAFKAQSTQGDPIHIEGEIVDSEGKLITKVSSEHDGMGVFTITPDRNQPMYLQVTDPPGFDSLYALPMGHDQGWQMSGKVENEKIILEINRQDTPDDIALITLMIRGQLFHYQQIRVKKSENVNIPLKGLPAGIAVLTLFDRNMNPRAERLFYVNPTGELDVQMESKLRSYVPRDKVGLEISLSAKELDLLKGSYSLSVVDEQLGYTEFIKESNIRSAFLLSPEIKGKINNPNYYMDVEGPGVSKHL
ncbi:MAG: hypothetical protein QNK35_14010, partial [Bacteroides sp.]|nr:hypothetical protein [Bacteroides sp.]